MITDVLAEAKEKMHSAVEYAKNDFATVRTGRANPALFEKIMVEYYGTPTPLQQLASLQNPEARTLLITPYDKTALKEIEKAIVNFPNLGANPSNDGTIIRVTMPELTEDRRKEYVKIVRTKGEDAKIAIRNIRRDANNELKEMVKEKMISEDDERRGNAEIQKVTDDAVAEVDKLLDAKEQEMMSV